MTRLNANVYRRQLENHPDRITNKEGGMAFKMSPKLELYSRVASCLVGEPKFYDSNNSGDARIIQLIQQLAETDPKFILQLAVYTRNKMNLRTIPIVLLVQAAINKKTQGYVRSAARQIVTRVDQMMEALAYCQMLIGDLGDRKTTGSMPHALKMGLADCFENFNAYQFGKYDSQGAGKAKLHDVIRLVHPKPKDKERSALYKKIAKNELDASETWENALMTKGASKQTWEEIIPKMPIMASLRNLRNVLKHKVSHGSIQTITDKLEDEKTILNSKQFPFRFLSAYREVAGMTDPTDIWDKKQVLYALVKSMNIAVKNLPRLPGYTAAFADNSGSMTSTISDKSSVARQDIANMFLAITNQLSDNALTGIFGTDFAVKDMMVSDNVFANMQTIVNDEVGSSTNAYLAIEYLLNNRIVVDRIFLFSDEQCYNSYSYGYNSNAQLAPVLRKYRQQVNPKAFFYSIDLAGYGQAVVPEDDPRSVLYAGFSEKILEYVPLFEKAAEAREGKTANTALQEIEAINIWGLSEMNIK